MPCRDVFALGSSQQRVNAPTAQEVSHSSKTDVNDLCSPFCMCSCCSVMSEVSKPISIAIIFPQVISDYQILAPSQVTSLPLSVWQPPKLG
ncbi:hypothetical protein [Pedobacter sp. HDW13]